MKKELDKQNQFLLKIELKSLMILKRSHKSVYDESKFQNYVTT